MWRLALVLAVVATVTVCGGVDGSVDPCAEVEHVVRKCEEAYERGEHVVALTVVQQFNSETALPPCPQLWQCIGATSYGVGNLQQAIEAFSRVGVKSCM